MKKRLIIYDCGGSDLPSPFPEEEGDLLFPASPAIKSCIGCFGCWLKTPGRCAIPDRGASMPSLIKGCDELIIISPLLYGGFSASVKAVVDRSIGYVAPFFRMVNGEMHHKLKTDHSYRLSVFFYGPCDKEEQDIARELVKGNALNLGAAGHRVSFHDSFLSAKEAAL